jgi:hypothetical protein
MHSENKSIHEAGNDGKITAVRTSHELFANLDKLHTTELGAKRIRRNLCLDIKDDVVEWCKQRIGDTNSHIIRKGKNWYVTTDGCIITVNIHSNTIITAGKTQTKEQDD